MAMTKFLTLLKEYIYIKPKINSKWFESSNQHETSLTLYGSPFCNIYSHLFEGFCINIRPIRLCHIDVHTDQNLMLVCVSLRAHAHDTRNELKPV